MRTASLFLLLPLALLTAPLALANTHFGNCEARTGSSATLILPGSALEASEISLSAGSEIALFTPDGVCAGHAVWEGGSLAVAVWEDDPQTGDQDGFTAGEALRLAVWDEASSTEYDDIEAVLDPVYAEALVFASDAIYLVSDLVTGTVNVEEGAALAYALDANYPNPFVSETTIRYALAAESDVRLEVYNLLGQRVAEVVNERQQPGGYEVAFRPPANLSSGTYLYRIVADTFTEHRRMVLVR